MTVKLKFPGAQSEADADPRSAGGKDDLDFLETSEVCVRRGAIQVLSERVGDDAKGLGRA